MVNFASVNTASELKQKRWFFKSASAILVRRGFSDGTPACTALLLIYVHNITDSLHKVVVPLSHNPFSPAVRRTLTVMIHHSSWKDVAPSALSVPLLNIFNPHPCTELKSSADIFFLCSEEHLEFLQYSIWVWLQESNPQHRRVHLTL